jgi:hypothetical protein
MSSTKLKRTLALALAGGSLAIGVPAAIAASGGDDRAPASTFIQDEGQQSRPDREDCPEKDGRSGGGDGSAEQGASTPEPSV